MARRTSVARRRGGIPARPRNALMDRHAHGTFRSPAAKPGTRRRRWVPTLDVVPLTALASHSIASSYRGSLSLPNPSSARSRSPFKQWTTAPGICRDPNRRRGPRMLQHVPATPAARHLRGGAQLVEEDQRPDRAGVFGAVAATGLDQKPTGSCASRIAETAGSAWRRSCSTNDCQVAGGSSRSSRRELDGARWRRLALQQPGQRVGVQRGPPSIQADFVRSRCS